MKGKYIITSIIVTIVLFFLLGYIENKISGNTFETNVLVLKQDISVNKYEKLNPEQFDVINVPSSVAINSVFDKKDIQNKYALEDIYGGEILRNEKVGDKNQLQLVKIDPNKRKLAISVTKLEDGVAGQIRKNSLVDILFTNSPTSKNPEVSTETILQQIKVLGVTDSKGSLIDGTSSSKVAAVILSVTPEQAHLLVNREGKGKFRFIEVAKDAKTYDKIIVK